MKCPNCSTENPIKALKCVKCETILPWIDPDTKAKRYIPNYLAPAILVTIFCCFPLGIVGLIYATQVNGRLIAGEYDKAVTSSLNARLWCWITFGVGIAFWTFYLFIYGIIIWAAIMDKL